MSLAARQVGGCFNQCLGQGILAQTCGTVDYKCICSSTFINGFQTCISTICTSGDIPSAQQSFQTLCSETGNSLATPLPTVLASTSSAQGHNSATLSPPGTLPTTGTSSGNSNPGPLTNNNLRVKPGIPLGRIIGGAVGGVSIFLIILLIIFWRIRRRRRAQNVINTLHMVQAHSHILQPQSPPVTVFQPQPPPPPQNPPYIPLSNPSPAWTSQDMSYNAQVNTAGYDHGLVYPGTYPSPAQGYGNNHPNLNYPSQSRYVPPGTQTPVRLEYPGPNVNTQSLNIENHNYYSAPESNPQPPQSESSYFSSDVKTPLASPSEQHLLKSTPGVPQSGASSPPFTASPPSTQGPSIRPELGDDIDGATGFHVTNPHAMDGSDDMSTARSAQRESIQPGSDGPPGGFRIVNPGGAQPRAGDTKGSSSDAPPVYSEKS